MSNQPFTTSTSTGAVDPTSATQNPPAAVEQQIPCPICYELYDSEVAVCQHLSLPETECAKWAAILLENLDRHEDDGM